MKKIEINEINEKRKFHVAYRESLLFKLPKPSAQSEEAISGLG